MKVISTFVGNTKKSEISLRCRLFKRDNQVWRVESRVTTVMNKPEKS